ncbi:MAG TPA: hypothetical protein PK961_13490 [bacterium]|nr:hypothetical protein [bacterium]
MDREQIVARLNLHAVLPVLAKIVRFDQEAQDIVKDWNATIQFSYLGGPTVQLKFNDGACRAYRQPAARADVSFWFPTAGLLNAMFSGEGFTLPLINGFWNVKLLKGFMALSKRLEHYLKELDGQQLSPELTEKVLECKLSVATWASAVLAEFDDKLKPIADHMIPGCVVNIVIKPNGPNFYFKKTTAGSFLAGDGLMKDPSAELTFATPDVAFDLVNGTLDAMAATGKGEVSIRGLVMMVDDLSVILNHVEDYLA